MLFEGRPNWKNTNHRTTATRIDGVEIFIASNGMNDPIHFEMATAEECLEYVRLEAKTLLGAVDEVDKKYPIAPAKEKILLEKRKIKGIIVEHEANVSNLTNRLKSAEINLEEARVSLERIEKQLQEIS